MYKKQTFIIEGVAPLICHNGQLADPLNETAKALKEVSGKRKKTDADYGEMSRIEWYGGLYLNEDRRPGIPGENIEAMLVAAAKKSRLGEQFKSGVISDGFWLIEHDGPKDLDKLWEDKRFRDRRGVKISMSTVFRTRPIFRSWRLTFDVSFLPDLVNASQIVEAVNVAGRIIGLCDYTPKYGRFVIAE